MTSKTVRIASIRSTIALSILLLVLSAGVIAAAYRHYEFHRLETIEEKSHELLAISALKAEQISRWRKERLGDAEIIREDPLVRRFLHTKLSTEESLRLRVQILSWFKKIVSIHDYDALALILPSGAVIGWDTSNSRVFPSPSPELMKAAGQRMRVVFSDLYRPAGLENPILDLLVPISPGPPGEVSDSAVLVMRIDPSSFLFPTIESWPGLGESSETLIVRRDGEEVVILNAPRHGTRMPLSLRLPIAKKNLVAARAAKGQEGILAEEDYRGVPVLAAVRSVANTPWYVVAKQDMSEVYAPVRQSAWLAGIAAGSLILALTVLFGAALWLQRKEHHRSQFESRSMHEQLEKRYEFVSRHANDIILLLDEGGRILDVNDRAVRAYGYAREELLHMNIRALRPASLRAAAGEILSKVKAEGSLVHETIHQRKDGTEFAVEVSTRYFQADGCGYLQSIVRDITERKHSEEALRRSITQLSDTLEVISDSFLALDRNLAVIYLNRAAEETLCRKREEILGQEFFRVFPEFAGSAIEENLRIALEETNPTTFETRFEKEPYANWYSFRIFPGREGISVYFQVTTPQKQAEKARDLFFTFSIDMIGIAGFDGYFRQLNPAWQKTLGWTNEELCARPFLDHVHPQDRNSTWIALRSLSEGAPNVSFENRYRCKDGSYRWISWNSFAVVEDGLIFSVARDVTARKHAEDVLLESETRYRVLIEKAMDGIAIVDGSEKFVLANPKLCEMLLYSEDEMKRLTVPDTYHPDELEGYKSRLARVREVGTHRFERLVRRRDGSFFPAEVSVTAREDGCFQAFFRDLTERKRAEAERELLAAAIERSGAAIVVADAGGTILYANQAFQGASGRTKESLLGQGLETLLQDAQDVAPLEEIDAVLKRGEVWSGRYTTQAGDGDLSHKELTISPVTDNRNELSQIIAVWRDVSRETSLEKQLFLAQKMEAIGSLAGGVAHDFNNLLTVVNGCADLLLMHLDQDDDMRAEAEEIRKAGNRAATLTRQLLAFSRKQLLEPVNLDLNVLLQECTKMLRRLIGEDIELETLLDPKPCRVHVDPGQIDQIVINLAVNARDAMPKGGKLTIETRGVILDEADVRSLVDVQPGPYVRLSMRDTGLGMDPQTLTRVFEPFFTTKERGKGTGLGLSTVYGIVKQSLGHIEVSSEPDRGTAFEIYFPQNDALAEVSRKEFPLTRISKSDGQTILVVEDDDSLRRLVCRMLELEGYRVICAENGEQALRLCEQSAADLLLTDMVMPGMSGPELVRRVHDIRPGLKAVYMSGYSDEVSASNGAFKLEAPFLKKPFMKGELVRRIQEVLARDSGSESTPKRYA